MPNPLILKLSAYVVGALVMATAGGLILRARVGP